MLKLIVGIILILVAHKALSLKYEEDSEETIHTSWIGDTLMNCSTTSTKSKSCMWTKSNLQGKVYTLAASGGVVQTSNSYKFTDDPEHGDCSLRPTDEMYHSPGGIYICYIEPLVKRKVFKLIYKKKPERLEIYNGKDFIGNNDAIKIKEQGVNVTLECKADTIYSSKILWAVTPVYSPVATSAFAYDIHKKGNSSFLNFQCDDSVVSNVSVSCYVDHKQFRNNISDPQTARNATLICPFNTTSASAEVTEDRWFLCEADGSPFANQFEWYHRDSEKDDWFLFSNSYKAFDLRAGQFRCLAKNSEYGRWIPSNIITEPEIWIPEKTKR